MRFAVLGGGSWGTALSQVLTDNGLKTIIYAKDLSVVTAIEKEHLNPRYFPSHLLPVSLKATASLEKAVENADCFIIAVPTKAYRELLASLVPLMRKKALFLSVGKGFDPTTYQRLSCLIREVVPEEKREAIVSLLGPSFAEEVIERKLTALSAVSLDLKAAEKIQKAFSNNYLRVYTNEDEIGAEYASALKNVIALASGMMSGLGYGDNTRAALITRGLAEMSRFGVKKGGKMETYLGLTGLGDLLMTCNSLKSRNFQAGLMIGKDDSAARFLKENKQTVEGVKTAEIIHIQASKEKVSMPIVDAVYAILYEGQKPSQTINMLMSRSLKKEV